MRLRGVGVLVSTGVAAVIWACGGASDLTTAPTGCAAALNPASQQVSAAGGSFAVAITISSTCEWTASSDAGWMTLTRTSGSGSGSAAYTVAANATARARQGAIRVGDQSVVVMQSPSNCSYAIDPSSPRVPSSGGSVDVRIVTAEGCGWSASTSESWISLTTTSGTGTATLAASASANSATSARSGSIAIEGHTVTISQDPAAGAGSPSPSPLPACSFEVSPRDHSLAAGGGSVQIRVSASRDSCAWSAQPGASWVQVEPANGNGSATVIAKVSQNDQASQRSSTIQVAGQSVGLTQQGAAQPTDCSVTLSSGSFSIAAVGGSANLDVTTGGGCSWETQDRPAWIRQSPEAGSGPARVRFTVEANTSRSARTATIRIGDQPVTFTQAGACTYSVVPASQSVGERGGTFEVSLTTDPGCEWTATSAQSWISPTPPSGSGSRLIDYSVAANTGSSERKGALVIATETVAVTQAAAACEFTLSAVSHTAGVNGGSLEFFVTTGSACAWSASTTAAWIQELSGGGPGSGKVTARVAPSSSTSDRKAEIRIAEGRTFGVTQRGCTFNLTWEAERNGTKGGVRDVMKPAGPGDTLIIRVDTGEQCVWQNSNPPEWILGVREGKHLGPGGFNMNVTCNPSKAPRPGSMFITQDMKIEQDGYGGRCP
jgi:hypothetical protein